MGLSAKDSRVFYVPHHCKINLNGKPPSGKRRPMSEQVTRIELTPSVYQRKYGHDKSHGTQDVCSGIKSWDGSISTKVADTERPLTFSAGDTVWVRVYPIGTKCKHPLQGYGVIDNDPIVCNLENGEPVEHNYRFSSKGRWTGFPNGGKPWGGFECKCGNGGGGGGGGTEGSQGGGSDGGGSDGASGGGGWSGGGGGSGGGGDSGGGGGGGSGGGGSANVAGLPADLHIPTHDPLTVYQWNGSAWITSYNECRDGFLPGAAPDEAGSFVGQMAFVHCTAE